MKVLDANLEVSLHDKTKLIILSGPSGIGKTSFLHHFYNYLRDILRIDKRVNISVFQNRLKSFSNSEPFGAWVSVIREMLFLVYHETPHEHHTPVVTNKKGEKYDAKGKHKTRADHIRIGLDILMAHLSPEHQLLKPLMSAIHVVEGIADNATTSQLSGSAKLNKIADLLCLVFEQYIIIRKRIIIVFL
jgi:predicted ATP-binding protein involved in virulence